MSRATSPSSTSIKLPPLVEPRPPSAIVRVSSAKSPLRPTSAIPSAESKGATLSRPPSAQGLNRRNGEKSSSQPTTAGMLSRPGTSGTLSRSSETGRGMMKSPSVAASVPRLNDITKLVLQATPSNPIELKSRQDSARKASLLSHQDSDSAPETAGMKLPNSKESETTALSSMDSLQPRKMVESATTSRPTTASKLRVSKDSEDKPIPKPRTSEPVKPRLSETTIYPLNGRWAGWYATKSHKPHEPFPAYQISLTCSSNVLTAKPLTKEMSDPSKGVLAEGTKFEYEDMKRFPYPVLISGSLHNHEEIDGQWCKVGEPGVNGEIHLRRLSTIASNQGGEFKSGQYFGALFDDAKSAWVFISFPWLEGIDGWIYGKGVTLNGVYQTIRGTYDGSKFSLFVTQWRGKKSVVVVFKGLISRSGSIFGLRVSTLEFGFETELLDLDHAWTSTLLDNSQRPDNTMSDESINFRLWRGAASIVSDHKILQSEGFFIVRNGHWKGSWMYGNQVTPDDCDWHIQLSTKTLISGYGLAFPPLPWYK
ncbi:hypothetical protein BC830DRAFT_158817 [Chytriomyces sp. MP71]|nr:hypothetical protein BC830DRAFT_158817 [Chytriomyces sp. MP71]